MFSAYKILFQIALLLILFLTSGAQIKETEPNNNCNDEGIIKILKNGTYSGTVVDGDPDWWRIIPHKNGSVRVSISVDSDDYLYHATFEVYKSYTFDFELNEDCVWIYRVGDVGFEGNPVSYKMFAKTSPYILKVELRGDTTPRNYKLTITGQPMKIFSGGAGTAEKPFRISTPGNLDSVRYFPNAHFIQTADINMDVAPYNSGPGWNPIGTASNPFTGVYDGDRYTISNLYINKPTDDWMALFGDLLQGELKNIGLIDVDITADYNVAALVGRNRGIVEECYSTGKIYAVHNAGGLVGRNISDDGSEAEILNSYSLVDIEASGNFSGGLVGVFSSGKIENCYSAGKVDGTNADGGLLGSNAGTIVSSFWDEEASGLDWSAGGTGKNTTEMKSSSTFLSAGWSRAAWKFSDEFNDGYPHLLWEESDYRENITGPGGKFYSSSITNDLSKRNRSTSTSSVERVTNKFSLEQNYPNPFNPSTTIKFTVPSDVKQPARLGRGQTQDVKLIVYDILGREVATLVNQNLQPGSHEVQFDASNLSSGMYIYRINVGDKFSSVKKMLTTK